MAIVEVRQFDKSREISHATIRTWDPKEELMPDKITSV